ncbi:DUF4350 domain-containing protein [Streptomyces sp. RFCAC02]|uniref:DUF4350 domain-containing protein n=1 Tax=Streptomyces sp. RFCAC02 TaxID=2499143 RepID=UPI00101EB4E0|nr:DUF4350 domain-containing protein [Streptomyces sp. RFCAC02]
MTTTAPATGSSVSPTARALWRRGRGFLLAAAILAAAGLLIALIGDDDHGSLDPRSATPSGTRALAELLADHGVDTTVVTTAREAAAAASGETTLVLPHAAALSDTAATTLRGATADTGGRTVLLAPDGPALDAFAPGLTATELGTTEEAAAPSCAYAPAGRAGTVRLGGLGYTDSSSGTTACYPVAGLSTLLLLPDSGGDTVVLGSPDLLRNEHLDEEGNAALALQLLGSRPHVVWYFPTGDEVTGGSGDSSVLGLTHPAWRWGAFQLAIAAVLAALWRARRLGPVVTERLPVVVHAAETTEGRARLYHRAGARDTAADALRTAARTRLAPLAGLAATAAHSPGELPGAVAARTGDPAPHVHDLLFGPPPADDAALVRLAGDLDALERRLAPGAPHASSDPAHPRGKDRPT